MPYLKDNLEVDLDLIPVTITGQKPDLHRIETPPFKWLFRFFFSLILTSLMFAIYVCGQRMSYMPVVLLLA